MRKLYQNNYTEELKKGIKVVAFPEYIEQSKATHPLISEILTVDEIGGNIMSFNEIPGHYFLKKAFKLHIDLNLSINITQGIDRVLAMAKGFVIEGTSKREFALSPSRIIKVTAKEVIFNGAEGNLFSNLPNKVIDGVEYKVLDAKNFNFDYNVKNFVKKDTVIGTISRLKSMYGNGGNSLQMYASPNCMQPISVTNEDLNLTEDKKFFIGKFVRLYQDYGIFEVGKNLYCYLKSQDFEMYSLTIPKKQISELDAVFAVKEKMTGTVSKIIKTSSKVYYYVKLDNDRNITTIIQNLKLIK